MKGIAMKPATLGQGKQLMELFLQHNVSAEQAQSLFASGLLSDLLRAQNPQAVNREAFQKLLGISLDLSQVFDVQVNWDRPLEDDVRELVARGFTFGNPDITTENFPNPSGKNGFIVERLQLVSCGKVVSTVEARALLDERSLPLRHPKVLTAWLIANYDQLLSHMERGLYLGVVDPEWASHVVYLDCLGSDRNLNLDDAEDHWRDDWLFTASPQVLRTLEI